MYGRGAGRPLHVQSSASPLEQILKAGCASSCQNGSDSFRFKTKPHETKVAFISDFRGKTGNLLDTLPPYISN